MGNWFGLLVVGWVDDSVVSYVGMWGWIDGVELVFTFSSLPQGEPGDFALAP